MTDEEKRLHKYTAMRKRKEEEVRRMSSALSVSRSLVCTFSLSKKRGKRHVSVMHAFILQARSLLVLSSAPLSTTLLKNVQRNICHIHTSSILQLVGRYFNQIPPPLLVFLSSWVPRPDGKRRKRKQKRLWKAGSELLRVVGLVREGCEVVLLWAG